MCCLKIDTETLLANCLNTCKTYSFSPDDLQQIVRLMANATDRYIFSDTGDDALHEILTHSPLTEWDSRSLQQKMVGGFSSQSR